MLTVSRLDLKSVKKIFLRQLSIFHVIGYAENILFDRAISSARIDVSRALLLSVEVSGPYSI